MNKLYGNLNSKYVELDLNSINDISLKNKDIFLKMIDVVDYKIREFESFKNCDFFYKMVISYNKICDNNLSFSILVSKLIIFFFNELNSGTTRDNYIKNRYDLVIFLKEKIYFLYLYMVNFSKIDHSILSQKNILKIIEINSLKIIENLCVKGIISYKNINIDGKTTILVEISNFINYFRLDLYNNNFTLLKKLNNVGLKSYYLINTSIFSMYEINAISGKTGNQFIIGKDDFIEEINSIKLKIDGELLAYKFANYCNENLIKADDLEEDYYILKKGLRDFICEKNREGVSAISKKISVYHKAIIFKKIMEKIKDNCEDFFYLPFIIDFRGRLYKLSSISPTFLKEVRECISFNSKERKKKIEKEIQIIEKKIISILSGHISKLNDLEKFDNILKLKKSKKIEVLWILISITEIFKKELGSQIKLEEFLDYAIKKINRYKNNSENIEDLISKEKFLYHLNILENIDRLGFSDKLISKDATASVYQHLVKILGGIDDNAYKYANLCDENIWYDTYSMIISMWKEKEILLYQKNKENIDLLFNRKTLKKTMRTENYGCGRKKCWEYYLKENNYNINNIEEIKKIFNNFYRFLTKNCIFEHSTDKIIKEMRIRKGLLKNIIDNSSTDFMYKKRKKVRINTTNNGRRTTMQRWETEVGVSDDIFLEKEFEISIRANLIHFMDSSIAREIIRRVRCIAIHDCFMVETKNISKLIAIANYVMNLKYTELEISRNKKKFFSIFILL